MSLLIVLCEKFKEQSEDIKQGIKKTIENKCIDARISLATANPMELLHYSSQKHKYYDRNVYFICLKREFYEKALKVSRLIRANDPNCFIVYFSEITDIFLEVLKSNAEAFDYLTLPINYQEVEKCVMNLYKAYLNQVPTSGEENSICIKSGNFCHKLLPDEIIYVESFEQKIMLHTYNKKIECFGYLKDIIKELNKMNKAFVRCHRSYIVNLKHIKQVDYKTLCIEMSNGDKCYLSREKKRELKELLQTSRMPDNKV